MPNADRGTPPRSRRSHLRAALIGILAAAGALWLTPPISSETALGRIEVAFRPGPGRTHLELPPVGTVTADTHSAPLGVHIQLQRLELRQIGDLADEGQEPGDALDSVRSDLIRSLVLQGALTLTMAALIAWLLQRSVRPRHKRTPDAATWQNGSHDSAHSRQNTPIGRIGQHAGTWTLGTLLALGVAAGIPYQQQAFEQPVFHGPVQEAPEILRKLDGALNGASEVSNRIDTITNHLAALSEPLDTGTQAPAEPDADVNNPRNTVDDTTTILHVSDIHSNPIAVLWVNSLHQQFDVDVVIDTGDITSFGYAQESATIETPLTVPREHYWIAYGNHDANEVRRRLNQRLTPLHLSVRTIDNITVGGIDDPTFTPQENIPDSETRKLYQQAAQELAAFCTRQQPRIIAVHNPEQADAVDGCADIVLTGHLHQSDQYRLPGGTRVLVAGTSGAGGVEGLSPDGQYVAQLLRFRGSELTSIDIISMNPETGEFTTQRINPRRLPDRTR